MEYLVLICVCILIAALDGFSPDGIAVAILCFFIGLIACGAFFADFSQVEIYETEYASLESLMNSGSDEVKAEIKKAAFDRRVTREEYHKITDMVESQAKNDMINRLLEKK